MSVTVIAALVVALALPGTARFVVGAPVEFWAMALGALVVDVPLFGTIRREDPRLRSTLSVCFTFAIFVLWGAAPAIVVQAVAGAVTALGQRSDLRAGLYLISRLVLATTVAELLVGIADRRPITTMGTGLSGGELLAFVLLAALWCAVSYGLLLAAARATVRGDVLRQATAEMRFDVVGTAAAVLVVSPLLTSVAGWWPLVIAAPVAMWNGLSRAQRRHEDRLSREPVSGSLNRQGLAGGVQAMTVFDVVETRGPRPFGIILIRSDVLFTINRDLGRDLYESVVTVASRRLIDVYGDARVARLAGEGLVIFLPGLTETAALAEAESAVAVVAQRIEVGDIPFVLDPAGGVALSPQHGRDLETLLPKAELAMSEARRQNRPAVLYVQQVADVAVRRIELLRELHNVLRDPDRHGDIMVLYQPQVQLATSRLAGVEALVRWTHPQWGPVPTEELIEAIEPTDVMHQLTRHVLTSVAAQINRWNQQGQRLQVAVNVSVRDLHDPAFVDDLTALVHAHSVPIPQLTIEITERMFIGDAPLVTRTCHALARLGYGLSLDDFGSGHASLQQLRRLPFTEVKIDRSYINGIADDPADRAFVTAVHNLARTTRATIVAEGVEDKRTADILARLEGMIGQGYYFARPMTADALQTWLHSPRPAS